MSGSNWHKSKLCIQLQEKNFERSVGKRRWMLRSEVEKRWPNWLHQIFHLDWQVWFQEKHYFICEVPQAWKNFETCASSQYPIFKKIILMRCYWQARWGKELSDSICDRKLANEEIKEKEVRQHPDISKDEKDIYSNDHSDLNTP